MFLGLVFVIAAALCVFVAYPLLSTQDDGKAVLPVDMTPAADLKRRRMVVYDNMRDLEFERQAKKIGETDYQALRESYRAEAARLMAASQELERGSAEDRFIENQVAARRARVKAAAPANYACKKCGFNNPVPVKYCGNCGSPLPKA